MSPFQNIQLLLISATLPLAGLVTPTLTNGSFESGLEGWSHNRAVKVANGEAADGKQNAVLTAVGETRARLHTDIGGLVPGRSYVVRYQARRTASAETRVIVRDIDTSRYLASAQPSDSNGWTAGTLRFTAPAASVRLEVRVPAPGSLEIDHFSIEVVD